ncbi:MAG: T9SS type A sorting domain-containing protein [Bacteroidales bacterium]|nr:T9SS type A sorting domain-containing protein [Bacteroidales bacterium]
MKRFILLTLLISFVIGGYAQLAEKGTPLSFSIPQLKNTSANIEKYTLPRLRIKKLQREDTKFPSPIRYAINKKVSIDIKKSGTKTVIESGTIWRYRIVSKNALSISVNFSSYKLPEDAKLFVYSVNSDLIFGAFTKKNNKSFGSLRIADYPGSEVVLEYFEPMNPEFEGALIIGEIGQAYRNIFSSSFETQISSDVDINCPEGDLYQLEKHAVARMSFMEGGSSYGCTGALINNVRNDGTPFFLTASHCLHTEEVAATLITNFNYEKSDCNGTLIFPLSSLSGATLKTFNEGSDFTLLLLSETPPHNYKPYYAGWNAFSDTSVITAFSIHHPNSNPKKIAVDYHQVFSYPYSVEWSGGAPSEPDTHWLAAFDVGSTEEGSSGSPLFDHNHRIIGQLHGGNDEVSLYGKLSTTWTTGVIATRPQKFLDPDNTGILEIDGYIPADNDPEAHFYSDFQQVCPGEPVQLYCDTLFGADSWQWNFDPNNISYYESTSETSKNPVVSFDVPGEYTISLEVTKGAQNHLKERFNYISAGDGLDIHLISARTDTLLACQFENNFFTARGATAYTWSIINHSEYVNIDSISSGTDTLYITRNTLETIDSTLSITVKAVGSHGSCKDSAEFKLIVLFPSNDNIENAIPIELGVNGPYYNYCAGVQENEPNPPGGDCETQTNWCDCNVSEIILDNSVWFTFIGPESGVVGIDAPGFDDQIAVYEGDSYSDILSGNPSNYTILAANDDYFGPEQDYSALIEEISVTPGKTYWLQVDGSGCGAWGEFYIDLQPNRIGNPSSIEQPENEELLASQFAVFPNPASQFITIQPHLALDKIMISILNTEGKEVKQITKQDIKLGETIQINLKRLPEGIYILNIYDGKNQYSAKFQHINKD